VRRSFDVCDPAPDQQYEYGCHAGREPNNAAHGYSVGSMLATLILVAFSSTVPVESHVLGDGCDEDRDWRRRRRTMGFDAGVIRMRWYLWVPTNRIAPNRVLAMVWATGVIVGLAHWVEHAFRGVRSCWRAATMQRRTARLLSS
jgi:hypothetical protein